MEVRGNVLVQWVVQVWSCIGELECIGMFGWCLSVFPFHTAPDTQYGWGIEEHIHPETAMSSPQLFQTTAMRQQR